MSNLLIYDPRHHTFQTWACLMVELYATNHIPIPDDTTDWKLWGNGLKAVDVFVNEGIPSTDTFDNWQVWAQELMNAVNAMNSN